MRKPIYDDFTGFTFNGYHCSQFGLVRVSDGDRYEDTLVLDHSNEAADVPGGIGQYYWGEQIKERKFNINVAYDSVTEIEKREIKRWLHPDNKLHELIFDEKPYIKYWVKCTKEVIAKELCFNEKEKRIYKGEIDIEFTAFMPYGVNRWEHIPNKYVEGLDKNEEYGNINEWFENSGILTTEEYNNIGIPAFPLPINQFLNPNSDTAVTYLYNPGDIDTDFILEFEKKPLYIHIQRRQSTQNKSVYIPSTNSELSIDSYYIANPSFTKLSGLDKNNVSAGEDQGYIVDLKFISEITGKTYDLFEQSSGQIIEYHDNAQTGLLVSLPTYTLLKGVNENNEEVSFYIDEYQKDNTQAYIYIIGQSEPNDIYFLTNTTNGINMHFEHKGKYFDIKILDEAFESPKYWTEGQKMLYNKCKVRIDSAKQLIQYALWNPTLQTYDDNWIGINGILTHGKIFKIPPQSGISTNRKIDSDNLFTIRGSEELLSKSSNFTIKYPYLYI